MEAKGTKIEWFDLRRLTTYAAVSERTLRTWIHSSTNALPAYQVGKKLLISKSEFDHWIRRHKFTSSADTNSLVDEILDNIGGD